MLVGADDTASCQRPSGRAPIKKRNNVHHMAIKLRNRPCDEEEVHRRDLKKKKKKKRTQKKKKNEVEVGSSHARTKIVMGCKRRRRRRQTMKTVYRQSHA